MVKEETLGGLRHEASLERTYQRVSSARRGAPGAQGPSHITTTKVMQSVR
jgi:hypothetical protein